MNGWSVSTATAGCTSATTCASTGQPGEPSRLAIDDHQHGGDLRCAILNLNHPTLVAGRRAALDSERTRMEKDFENRTATRGEREERATRLLGRDRLPAFVSIRVSWLRKKLGR